MSLITSDQIKQYNQDGYVIVENVFSEQELKPVLKEFEDIVDEFVEKALSCGKPAIVDVKTDIEGIAPLAWLPKEKK